MVQRRAALDRAQLQWAVLRPGGRDWL